MDALISDYTNTLKKLDINQLSFDEDKYSGVFLPVPFDEYWSSNTKIMLVGRETAGWNTNNEKNTLNRIVRANEDGNLSEIISESITRYSKHLVMSKGQVVTKSRSRFKQFFFRLAKELNVDPKAIVYSNIFAWDYNKKSPRVRPEHELSEITSISKKLLASQIKHLKPDFVIFATGFVGIDPIIRQLFEENFNGHQNTADVIPMKLWQFEAAGATCFRIAHPRATHGHGDYRDIVIDRIKAIINSSLNKKSL